MHESGECLTFDILDEGLDGGLVGKVERHRGEGPTQMGPLQLFEQSVGFGARRAVRESHVMTGRRKGTDDRCTQPASSTRHEDAALVCLTHARGSRPKTSETFCPPNPNEFEIACRSAASRATFGTTSSGIVGSGTA